MKLFDASKIFTFLYEIGKLRYVIGIADDRIPFIASIGLNTNLPLPQNIQHALVTVVQKMKSLEEAPIVLDFNAPSNRFSAEVLAHFTTVDQAPVERTVAETVSLLKLKMREARIYE